jgi:hypothetical protein
VSERAFIWSGSSQACERVLEADRGVIAEEQAVARTVGRRQSDDLQDRSALLLGDDALGLDGIRQRRQCRGEPVLHLDLRLVEIGPHCEGHDQRIGAVIGRGRLHIEHVLDAVHLLLDRQRDGVDDRLSIGAGIARGDLHGRRRDRRVLGDRQVEDRHGPDDDREQRDDVGEDRPLDEIFGEHRRLPPVRVWPAPRQP